MLKRFIKLLWAWIPVLCMLSAFACSDVKTEPTIMFDFESDADLDRIHWHCRSLFSISNEFKSHGKTSLKMELYPDTYSGVSTKLTKNDWRGYCSLSMEMFNPATAEISISIRIDDIKTYPGYGDRYNHRFVLQPGENRLAIPLEALETSSTKRKLRLSRIYRLVIFMVNPTKKKVLYIDNIRLTNQKPKPMK